MSPDDELKSPTARHAWELAMKAHREERNQGKALILAMTAGAIEAWEKMKTEEHPIWRMLRARS